MRKTIFICDECKKESRQGGMIMKKALCVRCSNNALCLLKKFRICNQFMLYGMELWVPINHLSTAVAMGHLKLVVRQLKRLSKKSAEFYSPTSKQITKY